MLECWSVQVTRRKAAVAMREFPVLIMIFDLDTDASLSSFTSNRCRKVLLHVPKLC